MKMESLRRAYGIAEPVRRGMEMKIVRDGTFRPAVLGGARGGNLHEDILTLGGRDTEVGWEDVFQGLFPFLRCAVINMLYGDANAHILQATSSENLLLSTMRWRRGCAWIHDFLFFPRRFDSLVAFVCFGVVCEFIMKTTILYVVP